MEKHPPIDKTLARRARDQARQFADRYGIAGDFLDGLVSGVSELAANAALYGGGIKELRFEPIPERDPVYVAVFVVQPTMIGRNPNETVYAGAPDATRPDGANGTAQTDRDGHGMEVVGAFAVQFQFTATALFPARAPTTTVQPEDPSHGQNGAG